MKKTLFISFSLLFLFCIRASGQFYSIGQSRAVLKWERIENGRFSVVYPAGHLSKAEEVLKGFTLAAEEVSRSLGVKPPVVPLVLHTGSAISNAYAIWAPKRIELLSTPPQDSYAQPWIQQLALHEYRHAVQLSSLNRGVTRFAGYLFGQQVAGVSAGLFVPKWFLEGDAVVSETSHGYSGRGRNPAFHRPWVAQLAEKGAYSFPKATLGSYRDFVPDVYTTGYQIVATSRMKYGPGLWENAMKTSAMKPWLITPFNKGLKNISGLNKKGLYLEAVDYRNKQTASVTQGTGHRVIPASTKNQYVNYLNPQRINDSVVVALKKSLGKPPLIVAVNENGREKRLCTPGIILDEHISAGNGQLVWAEYRPHIRWETENYTEIVIFSIADGKKRRLPLKGRFYAPEISPDGKQIAAIEYDKAGDCNIVVIKDDSLRRYPVPGGMHASTPAWSYDQRSLVMVFLSDEGKCLTLLSLGDGSFGFLTPFSYREISNPVFNGDEIIYTETFEEKSQLFSLNITTGNKQRITDVRFGADYPSVHNRQILFNDYTANGFRIGMVNPDTLTMLSVSENRNSWELAEAMSAQETRLDFSRLTSDTAVKPMPYKEWKHLFGIHSWAPLYIDIGGETARPGVSFMSQNLLSTLFITAGYDYNLQEETGMWKADVSWKGWYPEFRAVVSQGKRAATALNSEDQPERFTWNETNLDAGITQNLNLSRGAYTAGVSGNADFNFSRISHDQSTPGDFTSGDLTGLSYRTSGYIYKRQAYRDLAPRLGVNMELRFRHTPFGQIKAGEIVAAQTMIYLPGLAANHSFSLYAGIQFLDPGKYRFSNLISISRGYTTEIRGNEILSFRFAYRFPLLYPDMALGGLFYLKRIRTGLYYDYTLAQNPDPQSVYKSTGIDLVGDFHLFGLSIPLSAGIRTLYTDLDGKISASLLFSVNFYDY